MDDLITVLDLAAEVTDLTCDHGLDLQISSVVRSLKPFKLLLKLKIVFSEPLEVSCPLFVDLGVDDSLLVKLELSLDFGVS